MAATLKLTAYEVAESVNIQENTSQLSVTLEIVTTAGTYNQTGDTTGAITINAQEFSLDGKTVGYNTTTVLYSAVHTVPHSADGSKSVTVAVRFDPNTPATEEMTIIQTVALTTIPRASAVVATDADIGAVSMVAVNRRSPAYTHSIFWEFGALSGWLKADGSVSEAEEKMTQTAIGFTLPEDFYYQIPNSPTGVCTLTCTTYLEDTPIGDPQRFQFTVTAGAKACSPEVAFTINDGNPATVALTGDETVLVCYASTAVCNLNAVARKGASIVSRVLGGQELQEDTLSIPNFDADRIDGYVVDSRGYTCGFLSAFKPVRYIPLTVNLTAGRTDPTSGNATVTVKGNYFRGSFGAQSNNLRIVCRIGEQEQVLAPVFTSGGYEAVGTFSGLNYLQSHSVTVTVKDALTELTRTSVIGKGVPVFDWGEEDFRFNVPVSVPAPAEDTHAVNKAWAVCRAGDTMTGYLDTAGLGVKWGLELKTADGSVAGTVEAQEQLGTYITNRMPGNVEVFEAFLTPAMTPGRTEGEVYHLLTTKSPVGVAHGGTGAVDAATARGNLGMGCTPLFIGTLDAEGAGTSFAGHGSYAAYLVMGQPRSGNSIVSCLIPAAALTTEPVRYQIADNTDYTAFNMWYADTVAAIQRAGGSGAITAVYGIN